MHDALLNRSMRFTLIATTSTVALAGLILAYRGLFELLCSNYCDAAQQLGWGAGASLAAVLLIRYRGDLIDD